MAVAFGGAESPQGDSLYGSPPRRSFCAYASSRAALHVGSPRLRLGAAPQDPLTLKLRLDTLSRCLRRILFRI